MEIVLKQLRHLNALKNVNLDIQFFTWKTNATVGCSILSINISYEAAAAAAAAAKKEKYLMVTISRLGKSVYILPNSVETIQKDIMTNGPVVAGFEVYTDFFYYQSGIHKVH